MTTPIPMSLFAHATAIRPDDQFILVAKDDENHTTSTQASSSLVASTLGTQRWILPAPTYASDPRGVDGSESYRQVDMATVEYFIKLNGMWYKTSLGLVNPVLP